MAFYEKSHIMIKSFWENVVKIDRDLNKFHINYRVVRDQDQLQHFIEYGAFECEIIFPEYIEGTKAFLSWRLIPITAARISRKLFRKECDRKLVVDMAKKYGHNNIQSMKTFIIFDECWNKASK